MKTLRLNRMLLLGFLVTGSIATTAQSTLESEVPGDNFSLEGALELFKKSASPEEFEKRLNSPDSKVNNLDLNNDNYTDYIRVIDRTDRNVHAFILQAVLSENESQDVAVIELEKLHNGKAVLQITGDADVYGIETIIEPTEEVRTYAGTTTSRTVVNVWAWPSVQYVYSPYYSVWVSPWQWAYQPVWWRPWRPVAYYVYDPWWSPYRPYYSSCHTHRVYYAREIYRPYRTSSVIVVNNYGPQINHYRSRNEHRNHDRYNGNGYADNRNDYNRDNSRSRNNDYRSNENGNGNQNRGNYNSGRPDEGNVNGEHNQYRSTDRNKPNNQHAEIAKSQSLNGKKFNERSAPSFDRTREQTQRSNANAGNMRKPTRSIEDQIQPQRQSNSSFSKPEHKQSSFSRTQQKQTNSSFSKPQQRESTFSRPQQQRSSAPSQSFSRPQQQRSSTPPQSFSRPQQQRSSAPSQSFSRPQQQRSSAPSQSFRNTSDKPSGGKRGR